MSRRRQRSKGHSRKWYSKDVVTRIDGRRVELRDVEIDEDGS